MTTERRGAYREYISGAGSPWHAKKVLMKDLVGWRCEACGAELTDGLDVHHATYETFEHERPDDLLVLCRGCHNLTNGPRGKDVEARARANRAANGYVSTRSPGWWGGELKVDLTDVRRAKRVARLLKQALRGGSRLNFVTGALSREAGEWCEADYEPSSRAPGLQ